MSLDLHANPVFCSCPISRNPIPVWHATSSDNIPRIFLLGDAAHPPVPYIGQGAMVSFLYIDISTHLF